MPAPVTDQIEAAESRWRAESAGDDGLAFAIDFTRGPIDSRLAFTRASTATYTDATGVLQSAPANTPRVAYDPLTLAVRGLLIEEQRTNAIRNNTMAGATLGVVPPGNQPKLPTYWSLATVGDGLTHEVTAVTTVSGVPVLRLRIYGTASVSGSVYVWYEGASLAGLTAGNTVTLSAYLAKSGGTWSGVTGVYHSYFIDDAVPGSWVIVAGPTFQPSATLTRSSHTTTIAGQGGAVSPWTADSPGLCIAVTGGVSVDLTLDIGAPQFEAGSHASSVILTAGATGTRAKDLASIPATWLDLTRPATLIAETLHTELAASAAARRLWVISDGTNSNIAGTVRPGGADTAGFAVTAGGSAVPLGGLSAHALTAGTVDRHAVGITPGGVYREASNGTAGGMTAPGITIPAGLATLTFGALATNGQHMNACFRRFAYYRRLMARDEMAGRTRFCTITATGFRTRAGPPRCNLCTSSPRAASRTCSATRLTKTANQPPRKRRRYSRDAAPPRAAWPCRAGRW